MQKINNNLKIKCIKIVIKILDYYIIYNLNIDKISDSNVMDIFLSMIF